MNYPMYNLSILDQFVEDTAEHFTDDLSDAMYLFPDGRMTSRVVPCMVYGPTITMS
ncbi:hypothetical protein [Ligilactobacillus acidipiscis]|uniref:hypothetical protein n=1 Tax=Ligilactobacillus acidipiscis TaxID=89059 RepID=UPI002FDA3E11